MPAGDADQTAQQQAGACPRHGEFEPCAACAFERIRAAQVPAGDAGLEWQTLSERVRERLAVAHMRIDDVLSDRDAASFHEIFDNTKDMAELIDRLQAQLAVQQAVIDAARWIEEDGWTPVTRGALLSALRSLPAEGAQAAQPEGEP